MTDALRKAQKKYEEKCYKMCLRVNKEKEADIVAWIGCQSNANNRIKQLIRREIAESRKKLEKN